MTSEAGDLLRRVLPQVRVDPVTGCWEWQGCSREGRYGCIKFHNKTWQVHRLLFHVLVLPVTDGRIVMHTCDNTFCVNWVSHLRLGTQADNVADMIAKNRACWQQSDIDDLVDMGVGRVSNLPIRRLTK